jgi:tRNA threonylcarbamoyladenosine biosynthesis protein TsaE
MWELGIALAAVLRPGDVLILAGTLGAGKTQLAKGIGAGLGVRESVTSPTFVLVRSHEAHARPDIRWMHHADVYRTSSRDEIEDLAIGELVEEDAIALVEWGDLSPHIFGPHTSTVALTLEGDRRVLSLEGLVTTREVPEGWQT